MVRSSLATVMCIAIVLPVLAPVAAARQGAPIIAPRDVLTITVFGEPMMSGRYTVNLEGWFEFPLIGRVTAAGLPARDVEVALVKRLADGFLRSPQVTVEFDRLVRTMRVFVMGEVRAPGAYQLTGDVTLLEALTSAGSTTPTASRKILVFRPRTPSGDGPILPVEPVRGDNAPPVASGLAPAVPDAEVIRVDLGDLQAGGLLRGNVALRDGDTVFVPRVQSVFITGHVRSPGAYTIEPGMTVLQALSLAGGLTDRGAGGRIRIIRVTDGETRTIGVQLSDTVEPGDTIEVPERFF